MPISADRTFNPTLGAVDAKDGKLEVMPIWSQAESLDSDGAIPNGGATMVMKSMGSQFPNKNHPKKQIVRSQLGGGKPFLRHFCWVKRWNLLHMSWWKLGDHSFWHHRPIIAIQQPHHCHPTTTFLLVYLRHEKNNLVLSITDWFNRDPKIMVYYTLHITGQYYPLYNPNN